jgi:proteasome lid subunit RPN8/RPN11
VEPEFGVWEVPGHSVRIEYSDAVMQQIRMEAVEGYHRVPHGGVETGGILFGTHRGSLVRILAWRPIACEYATGPSFTLSEKDLAGLAEVLRSFSADAELASLEPAGWYHSHTRNEIFLSDQDLEFFQRYFPQAWQVALVVRPASFAPARAGFFFREKNGRVHAENSYAEFQLKPSRLAEPRAEQEPEEQIQLPIVAQAPAGTAPLLAEPGPEQPSVRLGRLWAWKWYAAGLVAAMLAIAVIAAVVAASGTWASQPSDQRVSLSAREAGGQLRIVWDRTSGPIRDAMRGTLEIEDRGVRTEVKLTPADLRSGSISYTRQSGDIVVRLKVDPSGRAPVEELMRFLKAGESGPSPAAPPADPAKEAMEREAEAMRTRIEEQDEQLTKLRKMVGTMQPSKPGVAALPPAPVRRMEPAPPPGQAAILAPAPAVVVPQPKTLSLPPAIESAALTSPTPVVARAPAPVPSTPPPASGRIIWTGKFTKGGRVVIEGRHVSTGAIVGTLPAVSARVVAYPGDLTDEGMTLFTSETRYTNPKIEAAAARNGWNRTTYMFDPKRSARVRIVEQPEPKNGYRLVLQSDTTKLAVVVLEWRAAE